MIEHLPDLLQDRSGPCVSMYMPTGRRLQDKPHDVLHFRNLLRQVEHALGEELGRGEREAFLAPLHELADSERFWTHTMDGLAVFHHADFYKVYKLQRVVPERVVVADSFHIKPLLRVIQSADRFEVLALTREHVRLFHGNRDAVDEVELHASVPRTLQDAFAEDETDTEGMTVRFFRMIDRAIHEHHSRHSGLPLVLAALPDNHALFREISHNPHLLPGVILGNPDAFSPEELRQKAWALAEPRYLQRLQTLIDEYGTALPRSLASDNLTEVAMAAFGGRVRTLLVDDDRIVPGRVDRQTAHVSHGALEDPHVDDILDDLAEIALRMGGDVVMVPRDRMPSITGIAAIYRF